MNPVAFFFDFRSPYSYLAHTQLAGLPATFDYKPMDVLALMKEVGNVPTSVICPPKQRYARTDLGRWAARYGVPFSPNPGMAQTDGLRLLRAALAGAALGHGDQASALIFRAMWAGDAPLASAEDLAALLAPLGVTAALIEDPARAEELAANTAEAATRGVFGAPTFITGDEMFFGNDRLDFLRQSLKAAA